MEETAYTVLFTKCMIQASTEFNMIWFSFLGKVDFVEFSHPYCISESPGCLVYLMQWLYNPKQFLCQLALWYGVMLSKFVSQDQLHLSSEFDPYWVLHNCNLVPHLSYTRIIISNLKVSFFSDCTWRGLKN